jgi:CrcB protein
VKELIYVFIGGGTGSVLRFLISMLWRHLSLHPRYAGIVFPWPTLIVNVLGCFLIGLLYHYAERWGWSVEVRLMLTVGLCGGFTTFSTFTYEGLALLNEGNYAVYAMYLVLSITLGLLAVVIPMMFMD